MIYVLAFVAGFLGGLSAWIAISVFFLLLAWYLASDSSDKPGSPVTLSK